MPVQQREKTEGRAEEVELRAERIGLIRHWFPKFLAFGFEMPKAFVFFRKF
jgi:hypothetical protein